MDGRGGVAVSFLGDGATEEGVFHETLNLASVFKLPLLFVVENNFFSSHLHISLRQPFDSICRFAEAHGVPWQRVDGNDVVELNAAATSAIEGARAGRGPALIEAVTYRWRGHVGHREDNDVGVQRQENLMHWRQRDPIQRVVNALVAAGATAPDAMDALWTECRQAVADAWTQAVADPYPEPSALLSRVFSGGGR
jgi:pyruvate dehydrogenase E1 component alpha subunit